MWSWLLTIKNATTTLTTAGYVSLAELATVRGRLGLPVERDLHFKADKAISAYAREAQMSSRIVA